MKVRQAVWNVGEVNRDARTITATHVADGVHPVTLAFGQADKDMLVDACEYVGHRWVTRLSLAELVHLLATGARFDPKRDDDPAADRQAIIDDAPRKVRSIVAKRETREGRDWRRFQRLPDSPVPDAPETPGESVPTVPDAEAPECPKCGAGMVRRTAKRGKHAGEDFWGCSRFKHGCRETLPIAQSSAGSVDPRMIEDMVTSAVASVLPGLVAAAVMEAQRPVILVDAGKGDPVEMPDTAHECTPIVMASLARGLHVFLVGPAGSGKSTIAEMASDALSLAFYSISVGPTTPTSKLFGFVDAGGSYHRTPFREAYEHGGVFLLDEMDNGHPGLIAELNQALSNGVCAFADGMVDRHEDFRCVATGNTYGTGPDRQYVGRNPLDGATLNRFVTVTVDYDEDIERRMVESQSAGEDGTRWLEYVRAHRRAAEDLRLPVIFSPRNAMHGAGLLAAGMAWEDVREACLLAGVDESARASLATKVGA